MIRALSVRRGAAPSRGRPARLRRLGPSGTTLSLIGLFLFGLGPMGCAKTLSGDDLMALGQPEAALVAYGRVQSDRADHHLKLGYAFFEAGLLAAAERELVRAHELAPSAPTPVFWLAELAVAQGDEEKGLQLRALYAELRPGAATRPLLGGSSLTDEDLQESLERIRRHEVAAVIQSDRPRSDAVLLALGSRVQGPGWGVPSADGWDARVTDAASRALGAPQLPEFPPPPSSHP